MDVREELKLKWKRLRRSSHLMLGGAMHSYWRTVQSRGALKERAEALRPVALATNNLFDAAVRKQDRQVPHFNTDDAQIAFGMRVFESAMVQQPAETVWGWIHGLAKEVIAERPSETWPDRAVEMIVETYLRPFHDYLLAGEAAEAEIAHSLARFADWAAWFGASELQALLDAEQALVDQGQKDRREFEKVMQRRLFRWLFDHGFGMVSREVSSPSGLADFVHFDVEGWRLPIEAKMLDNSGRYDKRQLPEARRQLELYMIEHGARFGAIALFDKGANGHRLDLPTSPGGIPVLALGSGRHTYVYVVQSVERPNATVRKKADLESITEADFRT